MLSKLSNSFIYCMSKLRCSFWPVPTVDGHLILLNLLGNRLPFLELTCSHRKMGGWKTSFHLEWLPGCMLVFQDLHKPCIDSKFPKWWSISVFHPACKHNSTSEHDGTWRLRQTSRRLVDGGKTSMEEKSEFT